MNELTPTKANVIAPMSAERIEQIRKLEALTMAMPQAPIETTHTFHAGVYARTIKIPAGVCITGALIKINTVLITSGEYAMIVDDAPVVVKNYTVFEGCPGRKQVFAAITDTYLTMLFATNAATIEEAEAEFTDEAHLLITNREGN